MNRNGPPTARSQTGSKSWVPSSVSRIEAVPFVPSSSRPRPPPLPVWLGHRPRRSNLLLQPLNRVRTARAGVGVPLHRPPLLLWSGRSRLRLPSTPRSCDCRCGNATTSRLSSRRPGVARGNARLRHGGRLCHGRCRLSRRVRARRIRAVRLAHLHRIPARPLLDCHDSILSRNRTCALPGELTSTSHGAVATGLE